MIERIKKELELVKVRYGDIQVGPNYDWFIIKRWALPGGWNKGETALLVLISPGYPVTAPDNFYVDNDLALASGGALGNASANQNRGGRQWMMFSYHIDGEWRPHADPLKGDNLLSFLLSVEKRLSELN
jgi:hypothetical protein